MIPIESSQAKNSAIKVTPPLKTVLHAAIAEEKLNQVRSRRIKKAGKTPLTSAELVDKFFTHEVVEPIENSTSNEDFEALDACQIVQNGGATTDIKKKNVMDDVDDFLMEHSNPMPAQVISTVGSLGKNTDLQVLDKLIKDIEGSGVV